MDFDKGQGSGYMTSVVQAWRHKLVAAQQNSGRECIFSTSI